MGLVDAEIHLANGDDLALVRRGLLDPAQVRSMTVKANADSGAYMLCINMDLVILPRLRRLAVNPEHPILPVVPVR